MLTGLDRARMNGYVRVTEPDKARMNSYVRGEPDRARMNIYPKGENWCQGYHYGSYYHGGMQPRRWW